FHASRFRRNIRCDCTDIRSRTPSPRKWLYGLLWRNALKLIDAPDDTRLHIHDPIGIGEIPRQLGKSTIYHARSFSEIALLERSVFWAGFCLPQRFAAINIQITWIGPGVLLQHFPVLLEPFFSGLVLCIHRGGAREKRRNSKSSNQPRVALPHEFPLPRNSATPKRPAFPPAQARHSSFQNMCDNGL